MLRKWLGGIALWLLVIGTVGVQSGGTGAPGIGDPYFPELGNGGYDAQHYTLDLTWNDRQNSLSGTVTMDAKATQDLDTFNLDFQGFDISQIEVNGEAAKFERDGHELIIHAPQTLSDDQPFTVAVTYSGVPGKGVPDFYAGFAQGWIRYDQGVFVASEPNGAALWFPVNDHPLDKATYTFEITVPHVYTVAANGLLQDVQQNGDTTTYTWESMYPMASYLATVNVADFVVQSSEGPNGLPIRNYFPSDISEQAVRAFSQTPDMIALYEKLFGPYPFEAYGAVVADTTLSFALETQTLSLFGREVAVGRSSPGIVIAHELAHQWFGDSVSLSNWQDIWLNEGFATYASVLWLESTQGRAAMNNELRSYYSVLTGAVRPVPPGSPPVDDLFDTAVYLRGAWTLHALRLAVGDDVFFKIMRTYYDRYKYANASTHDFIDVAEEVSGQDLTTLFNEWLFQEHVPPMPALDSSA